MELIRLETDLFRKGISQKNEQQSHISWRVAWTLELIDENGIQLWWILV